MWPREHDSAEGGIYERHFDVVNKCHDELVSRSQTHPTASDGFGLRETNDEMVEKQVLFLINWKGLVFSRY